MPINYTTVFTRLGPFVSEANLALSRQTSQLMGPGVGADRILDQFNDNRDWALGVYPLFASNWSSYRSLAASLSRLGGEYLGYALQNELNSPSRSSSEIITRLAAQMRVDVASVKPNACTATAAVVSKVGNGGLSVSTLTGYGSEVSEGLIPEVVRVECTGSIDSSGSERFSVLGYARTQPDDGHSARGSGPGPTLSSAPDQSVLSNGSFEGFTTTDVPDSWTIAAGAATTNVLKNVSQLHAFTSTLELKSSGVSAIRLTQDVTLTKRKVYCLSVWVKRSGGAWTTGATFTVKVEGTGWTAQNAVSVDPNSLSSSSFVNYLIFFATPENVPGDAKVTIEWTSATGNVGKSIYVSGCFLSVPTYHAGVHYLLTRGDVPFAIGDSFTVTTTNARDGKFQDWFTRFYGVQLPSNASPTISDSLVP